MHENIKKFFLQGEIGDDNLVQSRQRHVDFLENTMRDEGFVPSIDNEPQFTTWFRSDKGTFDFSLTVYGVDIGKEQAWRISGVTRGKPIAKV